MSEVVARRIELFDQALPDAQPLQASKAALLPTSNQVQEVFDYLSHTVNGMLLFEINTPGTITQPTHHIFESAITPYEPNGPAFGQVKGEAQLGLQLPSFLHDMGIDATPWARIVLKLNSRAIGYLESSEFALMNSPNREFSNRPGTIAELGQFIAACHYIRDY